MQQHFQSIPELIEEDHKEGMCLALRTRQLGQVGAGVGPPDLCHFVKVRDKGAHTRLSITGMGGHIKPSGKNKLSAYHFCYGLDCSSPAVVAAYFHSLMNDLPNQTNKDSSNLRWTIQKGTYCSYNALSKVDVRIEVTMPGSVKYHLVDSQGNQYENDSVDTDDNTWLELQLCCTLRALKYSFPFQQDYYYDLSPHNQTLPKERLYGIPRVGIQDASGGNDGELVRYNNINDEYGTTLFIKALRIMNPLKTLADENNFLELCSKFFWNSDCLGTDDIYTNKSSFINSCLTQIVKNYFFDNCRYQQAIDFFQPLSTIDVDLVSILVDATVYLNQDTKAITMLCNAISTNPTSANLLLKQSSLLLHMNNSDHALQVAQYVSSIEPSNAHAYINLANIYRIRKDYSMVLRTLNAIRNDELGDADENLDDNYSQTIHHSYSLENNAKSVYLDMVEPELGNNGLLASKLPSQSLKGVMYQAYSILAKVLLDISWDSLLTYRRKAFYMRDVAAAEDGHRHDKIAEKGVVIKAVMKRWLDQLFSSLYHDLMYISIFESRMEHSKITQNINSSLLVSDPNGNVANNIGKIHAVTRDLGEYIRYAILLARFERKDLIAKLLSEGEELVKGCVRGLLLIIKTYSSDGFVQETLDTIVDLYTLVDTQGFRQDIIFFIEKSVDNAMNVLICKHGLGIVKNLGEGAIRNSEKLKYHIEKSISYKVQGYKVG